jgi:hypothetical protein
MKSLAIIRSTDILRLKHTLLEMERAGLNLELEPKEINPKYAEKILSKFFKKSNKKYEVYALVPVAEDYEFTHSKLKEISPYSDVIVLEETHEIFKNFVRLIPILPDLVLPSFYKETNKKINDQTPSKVYLGVFANREVQVQTSSGSMYSGFLKQAGPSGVFFEPADSSPSLFINWQDIKKIIIPQEEQTQQE